MVNDTNQETSPANLVTEQVKQQAQQAMEQTKQATSEAAGQAMDRATSALDSRKDQGADMLSQTAQALRQTGDELRQTNGTIAGVVDGAAGQVDNAAQYLRSHSVNDLVLDAEDLARRNTTVFLGGAFVLGILAARFLKSSPPRSQYPGYGNPPYSSGGQYRYGTVPYPTDDVSGAPYVVHDYSPGLMGQTDELGRRS